MELNLPVFRASKFPTHNMQDADFKSINEKLQILLAECCPVSRINSKEELEPVINTLVETIQVVLNQEVPTSKQATILLTNFWNTSNTAKKLLWQVQVDADKAEAKAAQQLQAEEEAVSAAEVQKEKDDLCQEECKKNRANSCHP